MFVLQLAWVSALLSLAVAGPTRSRTAMGDPAPEVATYVLLWGAALVLAWAWWRRRPGGVHPLGFGLTLGALLLAGVGVYPLMPQNDLGVTYERTASLATIPVLALLLCPALAWLAHVGRDRLRRDPPKGRLPPPPPLQILVALLPLALVPLLAMALPQGAIMEELRGRVMNNGVRGVLFGQFALWGPCGALLLGSGLDALDGSRDAPFTRALTALAALVALMGVGADPAAAAYDPAIPLDASDITGPRSSEPLHAMIRAAPLVLLCLGLLVRRDLCVLGQRGMQASLARNLVLLAGVFLVVRFGAPLWGPALAPLAAALGCVLALVLPRRAVVSPRAAR